MAEFINMFFYNKWWEKEKFISKIKKGINLDNLIG